MIRGPFARALEAGRERFNARFAAARRLKPSLDPAAFSRALAEVASPLAETAGRERPEREAELCSALYDLCLDMVSADLIGPKARRPGFQQLWLGLLLRLPKHLAAEPRPLAAAAANALWKLSEERSARCSDWAEGLARLAPQCPDAASLLEAGKALSWRCGLAQYREGALAVLRGLPPELALAVLGLPPGRETALDGLLARLERDPWFDPAAPAGAAGLAGQSPAVPGGAAAPPCRPSMGPREGRPALAGAMGAAGPRIVARVGGFRGFGGPFLTPPRVCAAGGSIRLFDGECGWLLHADAFGSALTRLPPEAAAASAAASGEPEGFGRAAWAALKAVATSFGEGLAAAGEPEPKGAAGPPAPARAAAQRRPPAAAMKPAEAAASATPALEPDGTVVWGALRARLPELAGSPSHAATSTTLAAALPGSHLVALVAPGGGA